MGTIFLSTFLTHDYKNAYRSKTVMNTSHSPLSEKSEDKQFTQEDFSKHSFLGYSFLNCSFENCNFTESSWVNAQFTNCLFKNCNLSMVDLKGSQIQEVMFEDCKLVGLEFFKCNTNFIFSMNAKDAFIQYCNFSDLDMRKTFFAGSKIYDSTFMNTVLIESDFSDTDLKGTQFQRCNLEKSNFRGASQYVIDPLVNKIKKAQFSIPDIVGLLHSFDIKIV